MPRKTARRPSSATTVAARFNEAAARCRGKPSPSSAARSRQARASMRPRPDAAENPPDPFGHQRVDDSFNEAAARCRGKLF